ncbi:nitroreductase/quinone reductase family protein [Gordonia sp. NB41Y]|nr:nitroreductase/quinone reductase family protein [Gordonia sp. NB41Y]WLP91090.1 nitroreductase/quinone reductase family protein [Gordonia sp. NB41Y]
MRSAHPGPSRLPVRRPLPVIGWFERGPASAGGWPAVEDPSAAALPKPGDAAAGLVADPAVVIVTAADDTSGELRQTPLMRIEHDGVYAVVAVREDTPREDTPHEAGWYRVLLAEPRVQVRDGDHVGEYLAREVSGAERELWCERAVAAWPAFADHLAAADHLFPVFVLEPV